MGTIKIRKKSEWRDQSCELTGWYGFRRVFPDNHWWCTESRLPWLTQKPSATTIDNRFASTVITNRWWNDLFARRKGKGLWPVKQWFGPNEILSCHISEHSFPSSYLPSKMIGAHFVNNIFRCNAYITICFSGFGSVTHLTRKIFTKLSRLRFRYDRLLHNFQSSMIVSSRDLLSDNLASKNRFPPLNFPIVPLNFVRFWFSLLKRGWKLILSTISPSFSPI
jgi:hypothetical protein